MNGKGINMDSEVKNELENIEGRLEFALQKSIQAAIKEGFREIKDHIAELFNKDIGHINEHLSRHDKYHEEHFLSEKKMWQVIDGLRLSLSVDLSEKMKPVMAELENIKDKQIGLSVSQETADKIDQKNDRKKELSYGSVGILIAIFTLIGGGIGFLINYFS